MRKPLLRSMPLLIGLLVNLHAAAQSPADLARYQAQAKEVTIVRDKWGVPHIYGRTDAAAVFGLLYAQCEADFSRVENNYLEMLGRQSEAYGETYLYNDVMMRLIYDSAKAISDYQRSPAWMHALLDAFADGINYYLYRHPGTRPLLLRHFEPWYALMFTDGSVAATSTGGIRPDEIKEFYSKPLQARISGPVERMILADRGISVPAREGVAADRFLPSACSGLGEPAAPAHRAPRARPHSRILPSAIDSPAPVANPAAITNEQERETGSNGFAIAPARTANGNALLYINPHVPFYFRMEVHVVSEEGLNAYGAVTWGQFFVYQGFNAHCGWMHTSSYADVADVYKEKVSHGDSGWMYQYEGQRKPVAARSFTVRYKRNDQTLSLPVTAYFTHHGPVLASRDGKWLSLREYNRSLDALTEAWQITKAKTFAEYRTAMEIRANTSNNTVYADDQGNIAYWHGNFIPRRDTSYNWSLPVDGAIKATEWQDLHTLDEMVHVYNPKSGFIQNCNATPFSLSGSSSPDRSKYPVYMAPEGENFRGVNAVRLLGNAHRMTLDSLIAKGYDRYLPAFDLLIPALLHAYDGLKGRLWQQGILPDTVVSRYGLKLALPEAIAYLRSWNRRSAERSVATTLAVEYGTRMTKYAPRPRTPEDLSRAIDNLKGELAASSDAQKVMELAAVIVDLQQRFDKWWKIEWGDLCHYQRLTGKIDEVYKDSLSSMQVGMVSSAFGQLPSIQSRVMPGTKMRYAYSGNSFVAAVEFGKKLRARSIVTGGASSDPDSPHFTDQAYGFFRGELKDVLFYKEDVMAAMERQYHPGEE